MIYILKSELIVPISNSNILASCVKNRKSEIILGKQSARERYANLYAKFVK
jgi:hypothetical protein